MKVEILGMYGGALEDKRCTSFLVNDTILLDAGGVVGALSLERQKALEHVVISHAHIDHVKDLPLLLYNLVDEIDEPIAIHGYPDVIQAIQDHIFNYALSPDFAEVPLGSPLSTYHEHAEGTFQVGEFEIQLIQTNHPVPTFAMMLRTASESFLYIADTGPTHAVWELARQEQNLKGLIVEVSFPSHMEQRALLTGHLTPALLKDELIKFNRPEIPVFIYHLKPTYEAELLNEIAEVYAGSNVRALIQGEVLTFSSN